MLDAVWGVEKPIGEQLKDLPRASVPVGMEGENADKLWAEDYLEPVNGNRYQNQYGGYCFGGGEMDPWLKVVSSVVSVVYSHGSILRSILRILEVAGTGRCLL